MNLNDTLKDLDGNEFEDKATYRSTIIKALTSGLPGDEKIEERKFGLFQLAMVIDALAKKGDVAIEDELSVDDRKAIKDRVAKAYAPLVVGLIWTAIDPAGTKAA